MKPAARHTRRHGSITILTMIFLVLFTSLALAFHASSDLSLRQARNYRYAQTAQTVAESGLAYMIAVLGVQTIPAEAAKTDLLLAVANTTSTTMDGMANLGGGQVVFDGTTVRVPAIASESGNASFRAEISEDPAGSNLWLTVTGTWMGVDRQVSMRLEPVNKISNVFDYGVASKGKITIGGHGMVMGVNDRHEADILSATYTDLEAVAITGSSRLDGDICTANPDSSVYISGSPTIAGTSNPALFGQYIHIGVGQTDFPEVSTAAYVPLATNTLVGNNFNSDVELVNVRIPAGANPRFGAGVSIRGVLYVEQPNQVEFSGHVNIQGVIATADAGDNAYDDNTIRFRGSVSSQGVETLPDNDSRFAELREMPGSMILAPGFGLDISGSFDCINGAIACDKFSMTGNAGGIIRGPIICYGDTEFELWGSAEARIDRSFYTGALPGFEQPVQLEAQGETYTENR